MIAKWENLSEGQNKTCKATGWKKGQNNERSHNMTQRKSSGKVAKQASKVLRGVGSRKDARASAGSALSQRAPRRKSSR